MWYFLFFFVSGFCSILYELIWLRLAMAQFSVTTAFVFISGLSLLARRIGMVGVFHSEGTGCFGLDGTPICRSGTREGDESQKLSNEPHAKREFCPLSMPITALQAEFCCLATADGFCVVRPSRPQNTNRASNLLAEIAPSLRACMAPCWCRRAYGTAAYFAQLDSGRLFLCAS
jgi:hypothetical protein